MSTEDLVTAIREARTPLAAALVERMTDAERRAALPRLKQLRRELRDSDHSRGGAVTALLVVGAVCHTAPSGAADWIGGRDFEVRAWDQRPLLALLNARPAAWQRDVALRLARALSARPADPIGWDSATPYQIAEHLLRRSDTPPPAEPGLVLEWMRDRGNPEPRRWRDQLPPGPDLYARLRADGFTPVLAPLVFDADTVQQLSGPWAAKDSEQRWPAVLARLAAEGVIDRPALLGRGFARLVRGGGQGELRTYLGVVRALEPSSAELADNRRALLALLDGDSVLAGYALESLAALDVAGLLGEEELAEAAGVVWARPEKKLVRAQLGWLDRAAAGGRAGAALRAVAGCFGHPDRQVQGQALKVVKRHVRAVEGELLTELRAAALLLDPAHAVLAAELLGVEVELAGEVVVADRLPAPSRPVPMPAPLATPAELAEKVVPLLVSPEKIPAFELLLDGLVRQAWTDRDALAAALAPLGPERHSLHRLALAVAAGGAEPSPYWAEQLRRSYTGPFGAVLAARIEEARQQAAGRAVPFLLATPTWCHGALDARELVSRMAHYEELGVQPGPVDFAQALLRTVGDGSEGAEALTSPAGRQLAAWLRGGGLPRRATTVVPKEAAADGHRHGEQPAPDPERAALLSVAAGAPVPEEVRLLLGPRRGLVEHHRGSPRWPDVRAAAVLPHHREESAVRLLPGLGDAHVLLLLTENAGPCGPAVHLLLARACGAERERERTAAVDALLSLAAQRAIDPAALGREAAALIRDGDLKPQRLARTLTALAAAGAPRLAWDVLAALLPALLEVPLPRGTAELLATAVDRAREAGARGRIDAVTRLATGGGRSRAVTEAGNLAVVLG
ncbi:DUF6493 family protein [Kitasatospora sp. NPDC004272]